MKGEPMKSAGPRTIVVGSGNRNKIAELARILDPLGWAVVGVSEAAAALGIAEPSEPEETGETFEANAELKAVYYAGLLGVPCLADDSGLEVDALGGRPGVYSARYAAETPGFSEAERAERDGMNNAKLLKELEGVAESERTCRFVCAIALAGHSKDQAIVVRGTFEGSIGVPPAVPRGQNGFGYDPLFVMAEDPERTSAELSPAEKSRVSHRAKATALIIDAVRSL